MTEMQVVRMTLYHPGFLAVEINTVFQETPAVVKIILFLKHDLEMEFNIIALLRVN